MLACSYTYSSRSSAVPPAMPTPSLLTHVRNLADSSWDLGSRSLLPPARSSVLVDLPKSARLELTATFTLTTSMRPTRDLRHLRLLAKGVVSWARRADKVVTLIRLLFLQALGTPDVTYRPISPSIALQCLHACFIRLVIVRTPPLHGFMRYDSSPEKASSSLYIGANARYLTLVSSSHESESPLHDTAALSRKSYSFFAGSLDIG